MRPRDREPERIVIRGWVTALIAYVLASFMAGLFFLPIALALLALYGIARLFGWLS